MDTKLNKDVYKDVDAAYKAFDKFCAKFDYCSECPLNDKHPNCGVNFLYQAAPRRGRPPKTEGGAPR